MFSFFQGTSSASSSSEYEMSRRSESEHAIHRLLLMSYFPSGFWWVEKKQSFLSRIKVCLLLNFQVSIAHSHPCRWLCGRNCQILLHHSRRDCSRSDSSKDFCRAGKFTRTAKFAPCFKVRKYWMSYLNFRNPSGVAGRLVLSSATWTPRCSV